MPTNGAGRSPLLTTQNAGSPSSFPATNTDRWVVPTGWRSQAVVRSPGNSDQPEPDQTLEATAPLWPRLPDNVTAHPTVDLNADDPT